MGGETQADSSTQVFPRHRPPSQDVKACVAGVQTHVRVRLIRAVVGLGKPYPAPPPCSLPAVVIGTARTSKGGDAARTPHDTPSSARSPALRPGSPRFPRPQISRLSLSGKLPRQSSLLHAGQRCPKGPPAQFLPRGRHILRCCFG